MFYHLFYPLHQYVFVFNVFQYITFRLAGAILTSLFLSLLLTPPIVRKLKKHKVSQTIKEFTPPGHLQKAGTPTMGGIIILLSLVISSILWARLDNRFVLIILFSTIWLGLLGFGDDYLKLVKKKGHGLAAKYKLFGQLVLAVILGIYLCTFPPNPGLGNVLGIPFFKEVTIYLGWFYLFLVLLVVVGSSNAVNLTDGLDGLAVGCILLAAFSYALLAYIAGHARFSAYLLVFPVPGSGELTVFLGAMMGAALGFLWYNTYPAEVFMGDTGALFLGGTIGIISLLIKQELLLVLIGGIFVVEALSVIIQVISFKLRGKRVFRMTPLHHHFELAGWSEPKVVVRFWIVAIILSLIALGTLKLR